MTTIFFEKESSTL